MSAIKSKKRIASRARIDDDNGALSILFYWVQLKEQGLL